MGFKDLEQRAKMAQEKINHRQPKEEGPSTTIVVEDEVKVEE